uniref:Cyclin-like domain-containing protein n=1 Tax=viral metagenome TaxID=1070528 RepID=A0A6C0DJI8_9ZZZZ
MKKTITNHSVEPKIIINTSQKIVIKVKNVKNKSIHNVPAKNMDCFDSSSKLMYETQPEVENDKLLERKDSLSKSNTNSKTKKKKKESTFLEKSKLWEIFDSDKKHLDDSNDIKNADEESKLTCVYSSNNELCKLCNSQLMIMDDGFPTCTSAMCGVMNRDILDYSPEWRFYGADDKNANDPTRCGNPINPLLMESSFGCKVLCGIKSSYEMKKIRKWTEWQSMPHKEKSLYDEFQFITIMAQNAGVPKIFIDDAMAIHKEISEQKMFRGMNRDGIKSASIYISCRLNGCPRTAHEIAEIFKLDKTSATNGCSMAVNILHNIERNIEPSNKADLCLTTPSLFIDRYCSKLNFNNELTMLSKFIANKVEQNNIITDNIPHAIAAGIVYFVAQLCQMNITKQDIKQVCGVSEVTVNKCFKKLDILREKLLPKAIIDKYT